MQELRILSGYHRGATLPLDGATLSIGADEDADVVLADPGIAARHAQLVHEGGVWYLLPEQGPVRGQDSNAAQVRVALEAGTFARTGAIWLAVCDTSVPWQNPPSEPSDAWTDVPAAEVPMGPENDLGAEGTEELADDLTEELTEEFTVEADAADAMRRDDIAGHDMAEDRGPAEAATMPTGRHSRGFRMLLIPVTALTVLSAAAAYALTAHPAAQDTQAAAREAAEVSRLAALPLVLPPDQLKTAFRKRLGEIDLLSRVNVDLQDHEWNIRGALNDDDAERLQRMLRAFSKRYAIDFPVNVRIGNAESMLPFRISQVISGSDPSIVVDDGRRLYVGDEYRGVRLVAVAGTQLSFTGKHNLNVVW